MARGDVPAEDLDEPKGEGGHEVLMEHRIVRKLRQRGRIPLRYRSSIALTIRSGIRRTHQQVGKGALA